MAERATVGPGSVWAVAHGHRVADVAEKLTWQVPFGPALGMSLAAGCTAGWLNTTGGTGAVLLRGCVCVGNRGTPQYMASGRSWLASKVGGLPLQRRRVRLGSLLGLQTQRQVERRQGSS